MRLRTRFVLATMALITIVVSLTGGLFIYVLRETLLNQIGEDALDVAQAVARMPQIQVALAKRDPERVIQPLAESIREATGADFIVVGDDQGIRYSHPDPWKIGLAMVGGDNGPALAEGKEYVSVATGTLGQSIRGKVPVFDQDERIIGIVSVGFLVTEVDEITQRYISDVGLVLLTGLLIGVPGALLLARDIKKATHGLEPAEIASLAEERKAILGAIREGIIAIDSTGRVVVANATARDLVPGLRAGVQILDVLPYSRLPEVVASGQPEFDQQMLMGDTTVITNRVPVRIDGKVSGALASFRDRSELERLNEELSSTRRYTDELRAQAHEFANTLQAVSGMLQLGEADEAVEFIQEVNNEYRELVEALPRSIGEPAVAGLLLGKRARAEERHCQFVLDPSSHLKRGLPESPLLVRVVGVLVDNALEAVEQKPLDERKVRIRLSDDENRICIEVADSGPGVQAEMRSEIFSEGYTTKGTGRGIGLAMVRRLVLKAGGSITVDDAPEGGARFRVLIPIPGEGGER